MTGEATGVTNDATTHTAEGTAAISVGGAEIVATADIKVPG